MVDSNTIPVPASRLNELAVSALEEVEQQSAKGHDTIARDTAKAVAKAIEAASQKKGSRYTSLDAEELSTLTAFGGDDWDARDCASHYLEQYDVWSGEK